MDNQSLISHWEKLKGHSLGTSDWLVVDQKRIDSFADTTIDHQVIHIDPDAPATQKIGGTIAHGFLSLSLLSYFSAQLTHEHKFQHTVLNYGLNRVRFLTPVPSGSSVRVHLHVVDTEEKSQGLLATLGAEMEIKDAPKPAFVAEKLILLLFD